MKDSIQTLLDRQSFLVESLLRQNLFEWSKNEPIPELHDEKLLVVLLGSPGSGKSYFTKNFLQKYNDFKIFDPDKINSDRNKHGLNPEREKLSGEKIHQHIKHNTRLVSDYLKQSLDSKHKAGIIYDTTGSNIQNVKDIVQIAQDHKFTVVIILIHRDLETSKIATIKRAKTTGRVVDEKYLEEVYHILGKNWKEFSKLGTPYYLVDVLDNKYHFWKMSNGEFHKKEENGWIKTDAPNLYYQESLLEYKDTRSFFVHKNEFIQEVTEKCSEYLSTKDKCFLYRGSYNKMNLIQLDPKNYTREALGQSKKNYFGELFDIIITDKNWPSRYQSVIMTNDKIVASDFGSTVYMVIPVNGSRIVISPNVDFWLSFKKMMIEVGGFNEAVKMTISDLGIKIKDHIKQIDKIGEIYLKTGNSSYMNDSLFKGFDGSIKFSEFLIQKISESIDESDWRVVDIKDLHKESKSKEMWTDGECYMINTDYLKKNPELLSILGIKKDVL